MIRKVTLLSLGLMLCCVRLASADFYDECVEGCAKAHTECVAGITLYDQQGIAEAKEACANEQAHCRDVCHQEDAKENDRRAEYLRQQQEAAKKAQEQQETINGTIKVYRFDD